MQVLGDGLLGHVKAFGNLVDRARAVADELKDRSPARLGQSCQCCFRIHPSQSKPLLVQAGTCILLGCDSAVGPRTLRGSAEAARDEAGDRNVGATERSRHGKR